MAQSVDATARQQESLDQVIISLPGRVRDIATPRGLGFTCLEIGRHTGISAQAVSVVLSRHSRRLDVLGGQQEMLELSSRAVNALDRIGVTTRSEARNRDVFSLLSRQRNFGTKTLEEIRRWIEREG